MFKVVGKRRTEFTPKDGGQPISGYNLYVLSSEEHTEGYVTDRLFVSDRKFVNAVIPALGDLIDVRYNRYGKVDSVEAFPDGKQK